MDTAFKVAYSLVVAVLFILMVILGQRTFYEEPQYPQYPPSLGLSPTKNFSCDYATDVCREFGPQGEVVLTPEREAELSERERDYLREQRAFNKLQREHENDREAYFRNVFLLATALGVSAIGAAVYLFFRRIEAMPLGLLLGGIGVVIYGWVESARGPDEAVGTGPLFASVAVALVLVLAAGYWFLGKQRKDGGVDG